MSTQPTTTTTTTTKSKEKKTLTTTTTTPTSTLALKNQNSVVNKRTIENPKRNNTRTHPPHPSLDACRFPFKQTKTIYSSSSPFNPIPIGCSKRLLHVLVLCLLPASIPPPPPPPFTIVYVMLGVVVRLPCSSATRPLPLFSKTLKVATPRSERRPLIHSKSHTHKHSMLAIALSSL